MSVFRKGMALTLMVFAFCSCSTIRQRPLIIRGPQLSEELENALREIASYEFGQSRTSLSVVQEHVRSVQTNKSESAIFERRLLRLLNSEVTVDCKRFVCRQLSLIGSEGSVAGLAKLLGNPELSDMARYALQRIPGSSVDKHLVDRFHKQRRMARIGIINTLGERRSERAIPILVKQLRVSDAETAKAAAAALGKTGGPEAVNALREARGSKRDEIQAAVDDAYLLCADGLLAAGDRENASSIYGELYEADEPVNVRVAALRGLALSEEKRPVNVLLDAIRTQEYEIQAAAAQFLRDIPGEQATKEIASELENASVPVQLLLLEALIDRGDSVGLEEIVALSNSDTEAVQVKAFQALGVTGDASVIPLLVEAAGGSEGSVQSAARRSLYRLSAKRVDSQIIDLLRDSDPSIQVELIKAVSERRIGMGTPVLLELTLSESSDVRTECFRGLGVVAGKQDLAAVLDVVPRAKNELELKEAEKAILSISRRTSSDDNPAGLVLRSLKNAGDDVPLRCLLIRVLGKIGGGPSLQAVREAMKSDNSDVSDTAVRTLCEWPETGPLDDLLEIAKSSENEIHRVLALRGYIRLLGMRSDRTAQKTLELYEEVLGLTDRQEEKRQALAGLSEVEGVRTLEILEKYLSDKSLGNEAAMGILKVAEKLPQALSHKAVDFVDVVQDTVKNEDVLKRAEAVRRELEKFEGYITSWQVAGPYSEESMDVEGLFEKVFPPEETGFDDWKPFPQSSDSDASWVADLGKVLGGENCVAYLRTRVFAPESQQVRMELGSDDGVKVWLNKELVHANNVRRGWELAQDKVNVNLRKGRNELMIKAINGSSSWGVGVRFRTLNSRRVEGLRIESGPAGSDK